MYFHFSWLNHILAEGEAGLSVPFPEVNITPVINFSVPGFKEGDNRPSNGFKFIETLALNEAYAIQLKMHVYTAEDDKSSLTEDRRRERCLLLHDLPPEENICLHV